MVVDQGPCLPLLSSPLPSSGPFALASPSPAKDSWYTNTRLTTTTNTRRFSSSVVPIAPIHLFPPSPEMRSLALYGDSNDNTGLSSNTGRSKGFNLSRVFGSRRGKDSTNINKVDPTPGGSPLSPSIAYRSQPLPVVIAPCAEIAVDPLVQAPPPPPPPPPPPVRKEEQSRRSHHTALLAAIDSQVSAQSSQSQYYRHRVTEPYQPSQRFAAAVSVGFSPAQAAAFLSLAPPVPSVPPTKYGIPRLPRGTLSADKLVYLDWALAIIAAERNQADLQYHASRKHSSRGRRQDQDNRRISDSTASGVIAVAKGGSTMARTDHVTCSLGLEDVEILEAVGQAEWGFTSDKSAALQLSGTGLGSTASRSSSASSYRSAISVNNSAPGAHESGNKPSVTRSESDDSAVSASTAARPGRLLADLAWEDGVISVSGSENTNETEILLDDEDMQALKFANKAGKLSSDGGHSDVVGGGRRRSSAMSGTLGLLTSPVAQTTGMPPLSAPINGNAAVPTFSNSGQHSGASTEELGPTAAPPTTNGSASSSFDTNFFRRPSWSGLGRRLSVNAQRLPNRGSANAASLGAAGLVAQPQSHDAVCSSSCESRNVEHVMANPDKTYSGGGGATATRSPRARLLSFSGTKNRLGLALGVPTAGGQYQH